MLQHLHSGENASKIFPGTETCMHKLETTAKTVEMALLDLLGTKTGLLELHSNHTWVKTALQIFPREARASLF